MQHLLMSTLGSKYYIDFQRMKILSVELKAISEDLRKTFSLSIRSTMFYTSYMNLIMKDCALGFSRWKYYS